MLFRNEESQMHIFLDLEFSLCYHMHKESTHSKVDAPSLG